MLILLGLLTAIVVGWMILGPRILPPAVEPAPSGAGLDGEWTRTPDDPRATTLALAGSSYRLDGDLGFTGAGRASRDGADLLLAEDAACPDATGRYEVDLGSIGRVDLLSDDRAQTLTLRMLADGCAARAEALVGSTWVLRVSGRDGARGICDPPSEEPTPSGPLPEPSGCAQ
jgi:hypothetical protein